MATLWNIPEELVFSDSCRLLSVSAAGGCPQPDASAGAIPRVPSFCHQDFLRPGVSIAAVALANGLMQ